MTSRSQEDLTLRREALATRASLQRIELAAALERARDRSLTTRKVGAVTLRLARAFAKAQAAEATARTARPLLLSGGLIVLRALRASPTARWIAGAVAVGGAVWWVVRAVRSSADPSSREQHATDGPSTSEQRASDSPSSREQGATDDSG